MGDDRDRGTWKEGEALSDFSITISPINKSLTLLKKRTFTAQFNVNWLF